jgi:hypothetical protein
MNVTLRFVHILVGQGYNVQSADKVEPKGQNLVQVFISWRGRETLLQSKAAQPMLKTEPKQLLDSQLLQSIGDRVVTVGF